MDFGGIEGSLTGAEGVVCEPSERGERRFKAYQASKLYLWENTARRFHAALQGSLAGGAETAIRRQQPPMRSGISGAIPADTQVFVGRIGNILKVEFRLDRSRGQQPPSPLTWEANAYWHADVWIEADYSNRSEAILAAFHRHSGEDECVQGRKGCAEADVPAGAKRYRVNNTSLNWLKVWVLERVKNDLVRLLALAGDLPALDFPSAVPVTDGAQASAAAVSEDTAGSVSGDSEQRRDVDPTSLTKSRFEQDRALVLQFKAKIGAEEGLLAEVRFLPPGNLRSAGFSYTERVTRWDVRLWQAEGTSPDLPVKLAEILRADKLTWGGMKCQVEPDFTTEAGPLVVSAADGTVVRNGIFNYQPLSSEGVIARAEPTSDDDCSSWGFFGNACAAGLPQAPAPDQGEGGQGQNEVRGIEEPTVPKMTPMESCYWYALEITPAVKCASASGECGEGEHKLSVGFELGENSVSPITNQRMPRVSLGSIQRTGKLEGVFAHDMEKWLALTVSLEDGTNCTVIKQPSQSPAATAEYSVTSATCRMDESNPTPVSQLFSAVSLKLYSDCDRYGAYDGRKTGGYF